MSGLVFYIQFGHNIRYFFQFGPNLFFFKFNIFVLLQIEIKFNLFINVIWIFLLKCIFLLNIFNLELELA